MRQGFDQGSQQEEEQDAAESAPLNASRWSTSSSSSSTVSSARSSPSTTPPLGSPCSMESPKKSRPCSRKKNAPVPLERPPSLNGVATDAPKLSFTLLKFRKSSVPVFESSSPSSILSPVSSPPSCPPVPFQVMGALFETTVVSPVKLKGYLRVSPGDMVSVLDTKGAARGIAYVQYGDEMGKVPVSCLLIDQHCWNPYLTACNKILLACLPLLQACCAEDSFPELLVDILVTQRGALTTALTNLIAAEVSDKKARHLETETLRGDSAATRLWSALLQRPSIEALQRMLVAVVSAAAAQSFPASALGERTGEIMDTIVGLIHQILKKPPPELVTVVRALHEGNATHLALSFVCLRCFVPPLAQATMDMTVSEEVQTLLRLGAKGLQLVANDVEPSQDSPLYLHRAQLKEYSRILHQDIILVGAQIPPLMPRPEVSLLKSALRVYTFLFRAYEAFEDESSHKDYLFDSNNTPRRSSYLDGVFAATDSAPTEEAVSKQEFLLHLEMRIRESLM